MNEIVLHVPADEEHPDGKITIDPSKMSEEELRALGVWDQVLASPERKRADALKAVESASMLTAQDQRDALKAVVEILTREVTL